MNSIRRLFRPEQIRELSLVLLIGGAVLFFGTQIDGYYSGRTFTRISTGAAILAVVAVGQTLVVLTRNIDLSVGSIVGFTAYFVGTQLAANNAMAPLAALALALGVGAIMGLLNGLLVAYGKIPAIIVTLGTLAIYRSLLVDYSGAKTVTTDSLPKWLVDLSSANVLKIGAIEIRVMVVAALLIVLAFQLALSYLRFGRRLYAIGSNPDAARTAGLPAQRTLLAAYILCGALSGLAGFMFLARFGTITVVAAQGMELQAVAAVVVGGVTTFGGSGTMLGALLGTILINTLEQSLIRWPEISEFWRDAIQGLLILMAVATDAVIVERLRRLWARGDAQARPAPAETARTS
ncbi:MAG TPA: ABC transporter permease [Kouleothrix sp.]|uniref:ABC transporter permease n=1 Tax=Kouleothrix sp. TaxID=2779161 RepID=UPI002C72A132|nr:ABC transporter permease [Kouleothrix sp.]HRC75267.1 ABC transporter permease [Kouleothrix sp.]